MSTMIDDRVDEKVSTTSGNGDHDLFAHYSKKEDIMASAVEGTPIRALCGKMWVPRYADGSKFPVCPDCAEIYASFSG